MATKLFKHILDCAEIRNCIQNIEDDDIIVDLSDVSTNEIENEEINDDEVETDENDELENDELENVKTSKKKTSIVHYNYNFNKQDNLYYCDHCG